MHIASTGADPARFTRGDSYSASHAPRPAPTLLLAAPFPPHRSVSPAPQLLPMRPVS
jgi:hypothetical protein